MSLAKSIRVAALLALASVPFGCSDDGDGPSIRADGGDVEHDASPMKTGPTLDGGSARMDAQVATPETLYGAALGRTLVYAVRTDAGGDPCIGSSATGTTRSVVTGGYDAGGFKGFLVRGPCTLETSEPTPVRIREDVVDQFVQGEWHPILKAPLTEGAQFMSMPPLLFEWHSVGTVTVAAGTFQNCWMRKWISGGSQQENTYCAGVGRVSLYTKLYALELTAIEQR